MNTSKDAARAWPACTCCGQPCRPEDAPVCFACTLLESEETDDTEAWNYPEQHWEDN